MPYVLVTHRGLTQIHNLAILWGRLPSWTCWRDDAIGTRVSGCTEPVRQWVLPPPPPQEAANDNLMSLNSMRNFLYMFH